MFEWRVSLPMYDTDAARAEQTQLWHWLRQRCPAALRADWPLDPIDAPGPLRDFWRAPDMLLSQTCGWPLLSALPDQRPLLTPVHALPGCDGPRYSSAVIARPDGPTTLAACDGLRPAVNGEDSWSGFHTLRRSAEGGGWQPDWARQWLSGSHRASAHAVRDGRADFAAIDAVTLHCLWQDEPALAQALRVIGHTGLAPTLPWISNAPPAHRDAIAGALLGATPAELLALTPVLQIRAFVALRREDYAREMLDGSGR